MALQNLSIILLLTTLLILPFSTLSELSPSPSPSPSPAGPSPSPLSPSTSPPSYIVPKSPSPIPSPAPTATPTPPEDGENDPAPAPVGSDRVDDLPTDDDAASGRSNGGKKAGIAFGVIAGACVLGAGVMVYRKRQHNIRRSRYSYSATARREFL